MKFIPSILRGIGQVMIQNNSYTGILFLIGIFYNSWLLGLGAILGTVISTLSAKLLRYSNREIEDGLYGFNGTLTGIAVCCFFEPTILALFGLIIASFLSTWLMNTLKKMLPPFTAPFVIVTWLVLSIFIFGLNVPLLSSASSVEETFKLFQVTGKSFGQVMFQNHAITGLFFFLGILINQKMMAIYALYAAILGSLLGWFLQVDLTSINSGLMGYNAILCAIALCGKRWQDFGWITLAILASTILNIGLGMTGIITLTAPFVLVTWGILNLKSWTTINYKFN
ncbi:MAG: urea transporter [Crocinitomicaceae bacterium]|nr:urea transporter [Crocinitomicaceae bacterium]